jgi:hypothetical protein
MTASPDQHVAVKPLDPEESASSTWVERFARELRHARGIQHPHVGQVYDFAEWEGGFITMELASGERCGRGPARLAMRDRVYGPQGKLRVCSRTAKTKAPHSDIAGPPPRGRDGSTLSA